jgi:hypothetical protein
LEQVLAQALGVDARLVGAGAGLERPGGVPKAMTWSRRVWASRIDPSASRAMANRLRSEISKLSDFAMRFSRSTISEVAMRRRSYRWQRDTTVKGSFSGFVVAKTNRLRGGGSSRVFNRALNAWLESMWTSSTTKIRCLPGEGA